MVSARILGLMDVMAALLMMTITFDVFSSWRVALVFSAYLILKGLAFRKNIFSILDMICGAYILLALIYPVLLLAIPLSAYLLIKGFVSMF